MDFLKRSRFWLPVFGLFSIAPITQAPALDVGYDGYFRSRGNFQYNLDLDRDQGSAIRGFTDIRFRLNPTF
jgi:hypothetical protein